MDPVITVKDVIAFYKADRILYEMFVAQGMELGTARKAVAFFIWLKQVGKITPDTNIINNITIISTLIAEAEAILRCLQPKDGESSYPEIPLITSLAKNSIHPGFFNIHKDLIIRGLADIIDGIGSYVFNDHMYELLCSYEYSKELAAGGWLGAVSPEVPIALAKVYAPAMTMLLPEQIRSMFITFDSEFPIDRDEIVQHFTRKWGDCINTVQIQPGGTPIVGKIVFKSHTYINLVLQNDNQTLIYDINGRELKVCRFLPQKIQQTNNSEQTHNLQK